MFVNLGHGHYGFLIAALFGAALLQLDRKPVLAGVLFGCIAYKPQFGLLVPIVLAASGRWRAFIAAATTVTVLTIAVTLTFGLDIWSAFLASTKFTRAVVLEQGETGWHKIKVFFRSSECGGRNFACLCRPGRGDACNGRRARLAVAWPSLFPIKASALAIGTIPATSYSLDYDLMLFAPAIAFLAADGMQVVSTRGNNPCWQRCGSCRFWPARLRRRR